jgi:hypothetical protein
VRLEGLGKLKKSNQLRYRVALSIERYKRYVSRHGAAEHMWSWLIL